jgi:hypothetical protein
MNATISCVELYKPLIIAGYQLVLTFQVSLYTLLLLSPDINIFFFSKMDGEVRISPLGIGFFPLFL